MSVIETCKVFSNAEYVHREVERGVRPFACSASVTGAGSVAANYQTIDFNFNPDSNQRWQEWIVITRAWARTTVASPVGNALVYAEAGSWDRYASGDNPIAVLEMKQTVDTTENHGMFYGAVALGRGKAGTTVKVRVRMDEVNTMVLAAGLEGFYSDHPILSRWWLSA